MNTDSLPRKESLRGSLPGNRCRSLLVFLFVLFSLHGAVVLAEPAKVTDPGPNPESIIHELDKIEHKLETANPSPGELDGFLSSLSTSNAWARQCTDQQEQALAKTTEQLTAVGAPVPGEPADVSRQRTKLGKDKREIEKTLATCRVIGQRSEQMSSTISTQMKSIQAAQLLTRGPGLVTLLMKDIPTPGIWLEATRHFITDTSGLADLSLKDILIFVLVIGLAVTAGVRICTYARRRTERLGTPESTSDQLTLSLLGTVRRYVIILLGTISTAVLFYIHAGNLQPIPFINIVAYGLPLVVAIMAAINLFLQCLPHILPTMQMPEEIATRLSRRLKVLVTLIFIGYLLFATILLQSMPEPVFLLARMTYGTFLVVNLIWLLWLIGSMTHSKLRLFLRITASALLITALVSTMLGYHNLAVYIFQLVVGTIIVFGLYLLSSSFIHAQLDALDKETSGWSRTLRSRMGLKPDQPVPGLLWVRLLLTLALWTGLFFGLTKVWQIPQSSIDELIDHATNGFTIGSFDISPFALIESVLVLVLLLTLNSWFKKWLQEEWLARAHMDHGARESIATISGYVGMSIAFLVALSIAGMDLSRLALVAGALSVGIGFGLQNIVNNFISGLILLFERPVKTGDWIIVGDVEGYVKRISIRTTQIMTFDRADVIIPNTELISGNVTNMMLHNPRGRLRIPVGVAYGSDTGRVRDLLLEVASEHPEVMGEGFGVSAPYVLFIEFGDSSLNFELRCFVADINRRRRVISDLNFAIDEAFRGHGIEIPFPQRDIHIRSKGEDETPDSIENAQGHRSGEK